jgi:hypothetical protein
MGARWEVRRLCLPARERGGEGREAAGRVMKGGEKLVRLDTGLFTKGKKMLDKEFGNFLGTGVSQL